ncbi:hypothetical protein IAQ61_002854 [Plenodomus lingam]|uniref:uncharacterized protein n=1 Tax=Leptosphaeria maculans TaxID=5022 RepID=UPI0033324B1D|nr:hypothetical protein IAQ61_002854 [Plenodomus lingam]
MQYGFILSLYLRFPVTPDLTLNVPHGYHLFELFMSSISNVHLDSQFYNPLPLLTSVEDLGWHDGWAAQIESGLGQQMAGGVSSIFLRLASQMLRSKVGGTRPGGRFKPEHEGKAATRKA